MTNNMTEIKQSKIKLFIGWIVSHAVSIGLIGIVLALFLSSCQKVKAEDALPSNLVSVMESDISTVNPSAHDYLINNINLIENYPHVVRMISYDNTYMAYFFLKTNIYGLRLSNGYSAGYIGNQVFQYNYYVLADSTSVSSSNMDMYMFICTNNSYCITRCTRSGSNYNCTYYQNIPLFLYEYGSANGSDKQLTQNGTCNVYSCYSNSGSISYSYVSGYTHQISTISKGMRNLNYLANFDCIALNTDISWACTFSKWDDIYPPSVEDSRLQYSTWTNAIGNEILHIELTDFFEEYLNNVTLVSVSDLTLTLEYTSYIGNVTEKTFTFDSDSSFFDTYYVDSKLQRVYFNIPFTEFDDYNTSTNTFDGFNDVRITLCDLDLTYVVMGAGISGNISESVISDYYLQHSYSEITPDNIPHPDSIYEDVISDNDMQTIVNELNQNTNSSGYGYFDTVANLNNIPSWASIYNVAIWEDGEYVYNVNEGNYEWKSRNRFYYKGDNTSYNTWYEEVGDVYSGTVGADTAWLRNFMPIFKFVEQNVSSSFYDVVAIQVGNAEGQYSVNYTPNDYPTNVSWEGYIVLYTERYYLNKQSQGIYSLIDAVQKDANQQVENWTWLVEKIDDFEEKTLLSITGNENSLFTYISDLDKDLNTGISRIIESMPTFEPYNDHDVIYMLGVLQGLLETIIENQNSPHDGYSKYISWVKNFDDLDGFGNWSESVLASFKKVYSFFNYRGDINNSESGLQTYIFYVDKYVDMLLGNTGEQSVNTTKYYMSIFDGTYDVHNINGSGE